MLFYWLVVVPARVLVGVLVAVVGLGVLDLGKRAHVYLFNRHADAELLTGQTGHSTHAAL